MVSGMLCAPWPALVVPATILAFAGVTGMSYQCRLVWITLVAVTDRPHQPDVEDHMWYLVLPTVAYAVLVAGGAVLTVVPRIAAYAPASAVALLLLIGIHNSWDVVTYITIGEGSASHNR